MTEKRKRSVTKRFFGPDEFQGKGAFVTVRLPNVKEMREIRAQYKAAEDDEDPEASIKVGRSLLEERVLEWNWVDEEGEPMPQIKNNPEVIDELLQPEIAFLGGCITGSEATSKN